MKNIKDIGQGDVLPKSALVKEETIPRIRQTAAEKVNRKPKKLPIITRLRKFVAAPFYYSL
jgi:hypothetical protein